MEICLCLTTLLFALPVFGVGRLCRLVVLPASAHLPCFLISSGFPLSLQMDMTTLRFRTIIKNVIPIAQQFVQQSVHWTGG